MNIFTQRKLGKIRQEVNSYISHEHSVSFEAAFPSNDKETISWLQIVIALPNQEVDKAQKEADQICIDLYEMLKRYKVYKFSDIISIRFK